MGSLSARVAPGAPFANPHREHIRAALCLFLLYVHGANVGFIEKNEQPDSECEKYEMPEFHCNGSLAQR